MKIKRRAIFPIVIVLFLVLYIFIQFPLQGFDQSEIDNTSAVLEQYIQDNTFSSLSDKEVILLTPVVLQELTTTFEPIDVADVTDVTPIPNPELDQSPIDMIIDETSPVTGISASDRVALEIEITLLDSSGKVIPVQGLFIPIEKQELVSIDGDLLDLAKLQVRFFTVTEGITEEVRTDGRLAVIMDDQTVLEVIKITGSGTGADERIPLFSQTQTRTLSNELYTFDFNEKINPRELETDSLHNIKLVLSSFDVVSGMGFTTQFFSTSEDRILYSLDFKQEDNLVLVKVREGVAVRVMVSDTVLRVCGERKQFFIFGGNLQGTVNLKTHVKVFDSGREILDITAGSSCQDVKAIPRDSNLTFKIWCSNCRQTGQISLAEIQTPVDARKRDGQLLLAQEKSAGELSFKTSRSQQSLSIYCEISGGKIQSVGRTTCTANFDNLERWTIKTCFPSGRLAATCSGLNWY